MSPQRAGVPLADVIETLGRMSFRVDDPDAKSFSEADVELMHVSRLIGHGLSHVFASAIGRIADAAVAAYVTEIDPRLSPAPTSREATGTGLKVLFENFRIRFGYVPVAERRAVARPIERRRRSAGDPRRRVARVVVPARAARCRRLAAGGADRRQRPRPAPAGGRLRRPHRVHRAVPRDDRRRADRPRPRVRVDRVQPGDGIRGSGHQAHRRRGDVRRARRPRPERRSPPGSSSPSRTKTFDPAAASRSARSSRSTATTTGRSSTWRRG